jgi:hypothetical protein
MMAGGLSIWLGIWLPLYTEQWAPTYLQILFQNLLFALGAPIAVYNLVDADIKNLMRTRVLTRRFFLATALLYVSVCSVVLVLSPEPAPTPLVVRVSQQEPAVSAATPEFGSVVKSVYVAGTMVVVPFIVVVMGVWLNNNLKRERVAGHIEKTLLKRLNDGQGLEGSDLRDLVYMGEHGHAGEEKEIVLDIIDRVAKSVRHRAKEFGYKGYELESLIRPLPAMLNNSDKPGNDLNYIRAGGVLADTWRWLGKLQVTGDALATKAALRQLALRSVEAMAEDTSFAYLEIAADCDSHVIFDMGLVAIKVAKHRVAAAALTKLEEMAADALGGIHGPSAAHGEVRGDMLGMVACLAAEGPSGAMRAETALHLNEELFSPSLRRAINDAFDYHYRAGRFIIADMVKELSVEAGKMKTIDLDRDIPYGT